MQLPAALHTAVFHSLEEQIAVIDQTGNILEVNRAWQNFGIENRLPSGYSCLGRNYLDTLANAAVAGDSLAGEALQGVAGVLAGKHEFFYFEYPCHSPEAERWFVMFACPLGYFYPGMVVSHLAVTGGLALSDNLIQHVVGKGLLGRLSARFGEGAVNGILTSRIGLAARDVCRPVPQTESTKETLGTLLRELVKLNDSRAP